LKRWSGPFPYPENHRWVSLQDLYANKIAMSRSE
jgi:hypothetical protein